VRKYWREKVKRRRDAERKKRVERSKSMKELWGQECLEGVLKRGH
jgi:hypothetical protein